MGFPCDPMRCLLPSVNSNISSQVWKVARDGADITSSSRHLQA